jgi:lipocalin-like protein
MTDSKLFKRWILQNTENNGIRIYVSDKSSEVNDNSNIKKDGFEIKENGEFIQFHTLSNGSDKEFRGHYLVEGNTLYSRFQNSYFDSMFTILELNDNVLKLR